VNDYRKKRDLRPRSQIDQLVEVEGDAKTIGELSMQLEILQSDLRARDGSAPSAERGMRISAMGLPHPGSATWTLDNVYAFVYERAFELEAASARAPFRRWHQTTDSRSFELIIAGSGNPAHALEFARPCPKALRDARRVATADLRLTYAQFLDAVRRWSAALQEAGVKRGIGSPTSPPIPTSSWSRSTPCRRPGRSSCPINYRLNARLTSFTSRPIRARRFFCVPPRPHGGGDSIREQLSGVGTFVALGSAADARVGSSTRRRSPAAGPSLCVPTSRG